MLATRRAALTSTLATGALALLARPAGAQATGGVLSGTAAAVDLLAQQVMAQGRQPGMSVCVVEAGRVVLAKGYGVMELGKPRTVDEATLFGVASNTKAMTAACIAMLVDEGKVEWDAPVTRYLPQFAMSDETVTRLMTVRDLLVHRSGLSLGAGDLMIWPDPRFTRAELIAGLRHLPITGGFRAGYAYDNVLYVVAGEVIAAVSGMPWEAFFKARLLDPLGMSDSFALPSLTPRERRASPHARLGPPLRGLGEQRVLPFDNSFDSAGAAGGLNSCAKDIGKWLQAQLALGVAPDGRRLWSEAAHREMWKPQTITASSEGPTPGNPSRATIEAYALGWFVRDYRGERLLTHTGGLAGFISVTALLPGRRSGVMVMTNAEEGGVLRAMRYGGLDRLQGRADFDWIGDSARIQAAADADAEGQAGAVVAPPANAAAPTLQLPAYAGVYRDPWYGTITITEARHLRSASSPLRISFDRTPSLQGALEPFDGDTFRTVFDDRTQEDAFVTFTVVGGAVAGATMRAISPLADFSYDFQDLRLTRER